MAKAGRPRNGDQGTTHVRVFEDIAEMVRWIVRVEGGTSATLIDPMLRAQVVARYHKHAGVIERLKAAEEEVRRVEEEARQEAATEPKKPRRSKE